MEKNILEIRFVVFDIDGTLIDNMGVSAEAFGLICKEAGIPIEAGKELHLATAGTPLDEQVRQILRKFKKSETMTENLSNSFFEIRSSLPEWQNAPAFLGTKDVLKKLAFERIKIFGSSGSKTEETIENLKKNKLYGYFSLVLGGDEIPKSVEHIKKFAEYSGESLDDFSKTAIMIGDGTNDMKIAKASGIYSVGITNTVSAEKLRKAGADETIERIEELLKITAV